MEKNSVKHVTVTTLALMTIAAVVSLRGLPMMAKEGLSMIFYILFSTVIFLIPAALVSAELGSAFSNKGGGVYTWVKAAFGSKWGFTAIWLQWIQNVVWYPTVLGFVAGSLAYVFMDPDLATKGSYTGIVILIVYWCATFIALKGSKAVNTVAKYGVVFGTILPGILIILFGALWIFQGNDNALLTETIRLSSGEILVEHHHPVFFPHMTGLGSIAFLAGIILLFAGVEVQAVQVVDMENPSRQFPLAILIAATVIFILFLLGSLSVAFVVPADQLSLTAGLMQAFEVFFDRYNMSVFVPLMGLLIAFGSIGGVMAWVTGPSRGLLATGKEGELPPFLAKANANGSPVVILIIQAIIVSLLASLYFIIDNVSVAFFVLSAMTVTLYLVMYMLMFAAAIYLRITQPDLPRMYKVPGGIIGMFLIAGIGFLGVTFAMIVGFFPPTNLPVGNPEFYVALVASGMIVFIGLPLIINSMKKPSWKVQQSQEH